MKKLFVFLLVCLLAMANLQAQAVDQEICSGTAFTINSTAAATSGSTYRWLENGSVISGATAANYTIPTTKPTGVYTYVRQSKSGSCSDWQSSNAYTVSVGLEPGSSHGTMQNFVPCSYTTNSTWTLTDTRNDVSYRVRLLADGRFWMVNDLKYPTACNKTDFSVEYSYTRGSLGSNVPGFYGDCTNAKDASTPAGRGYLYDWMFVMQHPDAYVGSTWNPDCTDNPGNKADCRGICPEGWHVPTGNQTSGEFTLLNKAVNGGSTTSDAGLKNTSTFNAVYGGFFGYDGLTNQGSHAHYWSSSYFGTSYPFSILIFNTLVVPARNIIYTKEDGLAVRCVRNY